MERCNQLHEIWVPTEFHKEVGAGTACRAGRRCHVVQGLVPRSSRAAVGAGDSARHGNENQQHVTALHIPNQTNRCARPPAAPLQVYRRSGVTRPQLAVIPEPVDSQGEFNPARHTPLPLPIGQLVFGREPQRGGGRGGGAAADFVFLSIFKW